MTSKAATLSQLFAAERARVVRLIGRITGCRSAAEDLAQEAFLRLWSRPAGSARVGEASDEARSGGEAGDASYLFRTAQNLAIDHLRAQRVRADHAAAARQEEEGAVAGPEDALAARRELATLQEALQSLPERAQRVFLLNRLDGLSYADIAARLGVSVSTVEKDMIRALALCRRRLPDRRPK